MWTKIVVLMALVCVALGNQYPLGVSGAVCPDFPVCDAEVLSRFMLNGQPRPESVYNHGGIVPIVPVESHLGYRLHRFGGISHPVLL